MDKKEHIMHHALELFAGNGFDGTSIRDIAATADVNVAMVNYYFGSKDKLFEAVVTYKAGNIKGILEELAVNTQLSEIEKMEKIIVIYVNRFLSQPGFHRVLYQELLKSERGSLHHQIISIFSRNTHIIRSIIEQGIKKKAFRKVDPELTIASLLGTINQVMLSRPLCNMLMGKEENFDPYSDSNFRKRVTKHLQQLMHAHLLNK